MCHCAESFQIHTFPLHESFFDPKCFKKLHHWFLVSLGETFGAKMGRKVEIISNFEFRYIILVHPKGKILKENRNYFDALLGPFRMY